jgi:hypothetical protein
MRSGLRVLVPRWPRLCLAPQALPGITLFEAIETMALTFRDELREYSIDGDGIRIGEMPLEQERLLGGRPTRKRAVDLPVPEIDAGDH